ncbi:MAG: hypothetical protein SH818_03710 [Saprospiraceae bacterium]|nr:hypothetical protein [Saprospiraceae bacterium]
MVVLQIEHKVASYEGWKQAFENDPIDRKKSGVCRYRIYRPANDPNYVIVDLEFETMEAAENSLAKLRKLWPQVEGKIMMGPQTRILELVESKEY